MKLWPLLVITASFAFPALARADDVPAPPPASSAPTVPTPPTPPSATPATSPTSAATSDPIEPASASDNGPTTGFTLEARLAQTLSPIGLSTPTNQFLAAFLGGPPPVALGYRGASYALLVGPSFGRIGLDRGKYSCSPTGTGPCTPSTTTDSVTFVGATVLSEFSVAHTKDRRVDTYLLVGALIAVGSASNSDTSSTADDGISGKPGFGFLGGVGLRYWVAPRFGVGVEIGESYLNVPSGALRVNVYDPLTGVSSSSSSSSLRATSLTTFGALSVAVTF